MIPRVRKDLNLTLPCNFTLRDFTGMNHVYQYFPTNMAAYESPELIYFSSMFHFDTLKMTEKLWFFEFFRRYRKGNIRLKWVKYWLYAE